MKKILFVANVFGHFNAFHLPYIKWLKDEGYEVHCAANGKIKDIPNCDRQFQVPIQRAIFKWGNVKAYLQLKRIIETEKYDLIHCHTAMGGIVARLAARIYRKSYKTKVLYTAHEFHFYKNGPIALWMIFYPVEVFMSIFTDGIITINHEDYSTLCSPLFRCKDKFLIDSIGINFVPFEIYLHKNKDKKKEIKENLGYNHDEFILIYVGEHTYRKNHRFIIDAVPKLVKHIPNLKVIFTSRGALWEQNLKYIKQKSLENYIEMVGFVDNIKDYMFISDIGISASRGEGFGMNLIEEMFFGIPVVGSENKGHNEFIINKYTGFKFRQGDKKEFIECILSLYKDTDLRNNIGKSGKEHIMKYNIDNSLKAMAEIYQKYI